jgi:hypothetical protein
LRSGWDNFQKLRFWIITTKPTNPAIKIGTTQAKHTSTTIQPKKSVTSRYPHQETNSFLEESLFALPPQEANQTKPAPTAQITHLKPPLYQAKTEKEIQVSLFVSTVMLIIVFRVKIAADIHISQV